MFYPVKKYEGPDGTVYYKIDEKGRIYIFDIQVKAEV
jgi:hypothetical protein